MRPPPSGAYKSFIDLMEEDEEEEEGEGVDGMTTQPEFFGTIPVRSHDCHVTSTCSST